MKYTEEEQIEIVNNVEVLDIFETQKIADSLIDELYADHMPSIIKTKPSLILKEFEWYTYNSIVRDVMEDEDVYTYIDLNVGGNRYITGYFRNEEIEEYFRNKN